MSMKCFSLILFIFSLLIITCDSGTDTVTGATWTPDYTEETALAVEALKVTRGRLVDTIKTSGLVQGVNEAYVIAQAQGIIKSIDFELGSLVKKGQLLVRLEATVPEITLQEAKKQYDSALLNFDAVEELYKTGGSSQADYIKTQADYNRALALYENAAKTLAAHNIKAPITGYIAQKEKELSIGNLMKINQEVTRIIDTSAFKIEVGVGEGQVSLIAEGAEVDVMIKSACGDEIIPGVVKAVASGSDPATGAYKVLIIFSSACSDDIKSGMAAEVSIQTNEQEEALIIPAFTLVSRQGKEYVFVVEQQRAEARELVLGRSLGQRVIIKQGIKQGDTIIVTALSQLKPGVLVESTVIGDSDNWQ